MVLLAVSQEEQQELQVPLWVVHSQQQQQDKVVTQHPSLAEAVRMVPSCLFKINDCPDPGKTIANLISFFFPSTSTRNITKLQVITLLNFSDLCRWMGLGMPFV